MRNVSKFRRRLLHAGLAVAFVSLLALPAGASALNLTHSFDSGAQGWYATLDSGPDTCFSPPVAHAPTFSGAGGNPGGFISAADNESLDPGSGQPDNCPWGISSPSEFEGQLRANYGGTFSYDIRHPAGAELNPQVVIFDAQGHTIADAVPAPPPANTWTTETFTLTEASFFSIDENGNATPATQAQVFDVLEDVVSIDLLGDLSTNSRGDVTGFDNIKITEPAAPLDSDGDGVTNANDNCPTVQGPASNSGCPVAVTPPPPNPDLDGDGILNTVDKCPTQAGTLKDEGCPAGAGPGGGDAACVAAKKKLASVKAKLKKLKEQDASAAKVKKGKTAVKKAKAKVRKVC